MYRLITGLRNRMFDSGLLTSVRFSMPVIGVGNLTVGGTGKTPHTEYLIRLLKDKFPIAVLSRGYGRRTRGYIEADGRTTAADIGDEPFQMHRKFPETVTAVQEKRSEGIRHLLQRHPDLAAILLDDAFQHRHVRPSLNILLIDSQRPVWDDRLLPFGRLREPADGADRADIVLFTKCSGTLSEKEKNEMKSRLKLTRGQSVYFTRIRYGELTGPGAIPPERAPALVVSGIASPAPFEQQLRHCLKSPCFMRFSDHHDYTKRDLRRILQTFRPIRQQGGYIVTTEKDYSRMIDNPLFAPLLPYIFHLPIEVEFLDREAQFQEEIITHIRNYGIQQN